MKEKVQIVEKDKENEQKSNNCDEKESNQKTSQNVEDIKVEMQKEVDA